MAEPRGTMDESWDEGAAERGKPASQGSGEVHGSGANAGGGGTPENFDDDLDSAALTDGGKG